MNNQNQKQKIPEEIQEQPVIPQEPKKPEKPKPKWLIPIIIMVGIIILGIGAWAGYNYWLKPTVPEEQISEEQQEEKDRKTEKYSETISLDEIFDKYINYKLGFSIKTPKEMSYYYGGCKWDGESYRPQAQMVPVKVFEDNNNDMVYISGEYYYELGGKTEESGRTLYSECNKVLNSADFYNQGPHWQGWKITIREVKNDEELEEFIKENYGQSCKLKQKVSSEQEGVYDAWIESFRSAEEGIEKECFINYAKVLKYYPDGNRVVSWPLGQAFSFYKEVGVEYDEEMVKSFRFIEPDETANWKIYRNDEYGFEVKYPGDDDYVVEDYGIDEIRFGNEIISIKHVVIT